MIKNINYCKKNEAGQFQFVCKFLDCNENRLICCYECALKDHRDHLQQIKEKHTFQETLLESRKDCDQFVSSLRFKMYKIYISFEKIFIRILEKYQIEDDQFYFLKNEEKGQVLKVLDSFKEFKEILKANPIFKSFKDNIEQFSKVLNLQKFNIDENLSSLQNYFQQKYFGSYFQSEIFQINPQKTQLLNKDNKFNSFQFNSSLFDYSQQLTQIKLTQKFMDNYKKKEKLIEKFSKENEILSLQKKSLSQTNQQLESEKTSLDYKVQQLDKDNYKLKQEAIEQEKKYNRLDANYWEKIKISLDQQRTISALKYEIEMLENRNKRIQN